MLLIYKLYEEDFFDYDKIVQMLQSEHPNLKIVAMPGCIECHVAFTGDVQPMLDKMAKMPVILGWEMRPESN